MCFPVWLRPKPLACGPGQLCRFKEPSFGEELISEGIAYESAPYVELEDSPGHEAEKLVKDLAHVKESVGYLNKLVTLLTLVAFLSTLGLLALIYSDLSEANQSLARRYALLASIPIVAPLFTWFHIWLAIQMMFLPVEFLGLWQYKSSGMGLGWQGLVPRKCEKTLGVRCEQTI